MLVAKTVPPHVHVWVATLAQADLALRAWLDDRELGRFLGYQGDADRARFLLGAAMLRSAVGSQLGTTPKDVPVDRTCTACGGWHGRPVVPDSPFSLSVSHGGLLVALALAVSSPVGIDVERVSARPEKRTRDWTRAEARFKAGGDPSLVVRELTASVPGHVLSLVAAADATVQVLSASELLTPTPPTRPAPARRAAS